MRGKCSSNHGIPAAFEISPMILEQKYKKKPFICIHYNGVFCAFVPNLAEIAWLQVRLRFAQWLFKRQQESYVYLSLEKSMAHYLVKCELLFTRMRSAKTNRIIDGHDNM